MTEAKKPQWRLETIAVHGMHKRPTTRAGSRADLPDRGLCL